MIKLFKIYCKPNLVSLLTSKRFIFLFFFICGVLINAQIFIGSGTVIVGAENVYVKSISKNGDSISFTTLEVTLKNEERNKLATQSKLAKKSNFVKSKEKKKKDQKIYTKEYKASDRYISSNKDNFSTFIISRLENKFFCVPSYQFYKSFFDQHPKALLQNNFFWVITKKDNYHSNFIKNSGDKYTLSVRPPPTIS